MLNAWHYRDNNKLLLLQVVEHIAAYLGLDGTLVRERNFMRPNTLPPCWPVLNHKTKSSHSLPAKQAKQAEPKRSSPAAAASVSNGVKQNLHSMGEQEKGKKKKSDSDKPKEVICGRYLTKGTDSDLQDDRSRASPNGRYDRLSLFAYTKFSVKSAA